MSGKSIIREPEPYCFKLELLHWWWWCCFTFPLLGRIFSSFLAQTKGRNSRHGLSFSWVNNSFRFVLNKSIWQTRNWVFVYYSFSKLISTHISKTCLSISLISLWYLSKVLDGLSSNYAVIAYFFPTSWILLPMSNQNTMIRHWPLFLWLVSKEKCFPWEKSAPLWKQGYFYGCNDWAQKRSKPLVWW